MEAIRSYKFGQASFTCPWQPINRLPHMSHPPWCNLHSRWAQTWQVCLLGDLIKQAAYERILKSRHKLRKGSASNLTQVIVHKSTMCNLLVLAGRWKMLGRGGLLKEERERKKDLKQTLTKAGQEERKVSFFALPSIRKYGPVLIKLPRMLHLCCGHRCL